LPVNNCHCLDPPFDPCTFFLYTYGRHHEAHRHQAGREALPDLVHRAEAGEEIVITRQGRAVARLVAAPRTPGRCRRCRSSVARSARAARPPSNSSVENATPAESAYVDTGVLSAYDCLEPLSAAAEGT